MEAQFKASLFSILHSKDSIKYILLLSLNKLTRLGRQGSVWADENQDVEDRGVPASSSNIFSPPPPEPFLENHEVNLGMLDILGREVGKRGSFDSLLPSALDKYSCNSRFNSVIFVYIGLIGDVTCRFSRHLLTQSIGV